jgi:cysteine desulfuration protein SufE
MVGLLRIRRIGRTSKAALRDACRALIDNHPFRVFLADKLHRLIDDLSVVEDPQERLATIVDRAKRIPPLPADERVEANRVRACVSVVWLVGELRAGHCHFRCDAESPVVRGLAICVCEFFSGAPVAEVATSTIEPLDALGLTRNLSPTRRNGLAAVRNAITVFAQARLS